MHWIKLELHKFRSPQFIGAEPLERATWVSLLAYCADQENGGRLSDARSWGERRWMQTCGLLLREIENNAPSGLWEWDGDDLIVWGYVADEEAKVMAKRESGRLGGSAGSGESKARVGNKNAVKTTTYDETKTQAKNASKRKQNSQANASTKTQANATEESRLEESRGEERRRSCESEKRPSPPNKITWEQLRQELVALGAIMTKSSEPEWKALAKSHRYRVLFAALREFGTQAWPRQIRDWLASNGNGDRLAKDLDRIERQEATQHARIAAEGVLAMAEAYRSPEVIDAAQRLNEAMAGDDPATIERMGEALLAAIETDADGPPDDPDDEPEMAFAHATDSKEHTDACPF